MALGWPWVALCSPLSDFSFQLSAFQLLPNCGFKVACPPSHESRITNHLRLWVALPGLSTFFSRRSGVAWGNFARLGALTCCRICRMRSLRRGALLHVIQRRSRATSTSRRKFMNIQRVTSSWFAMYSRYSDVHELRPRCNRRLEYQAPSVSSPWCSRSRWRACAAWSVKRDWSACRSSAGT